MQSTILCLRFDVHLSVRVNDIPDGKDFAFIWKEKWPVHTRDPSFWWRKEHRVGDMIHSWRPNVTMAWRCALAQKKISPDDTHLHLAYNVLKSCMDGKRIGFLYDEYYSSVSNCSFFNPVYKVLPRDAL